MYGPFFLERDIYFFSCLALRRRTMKRSVLLFLRVCNRARACPRASVADPDWRTPSHHHVDGREDSWPSLALLDAAHIDAHARLSDAAVLMIHIAHLANRCHAQDMDTTLLTRWQNAPSA